MTTAEDIEKRFGLSSERLDELEEAASRGELLGEPVGEVVYGRPLKFGEPLKFVGFKVPESEAEAMNERAANLGLSRSDYLRRIVHDDLMAAAV